jgi:hypothetical protein
MKIDMLQLTNTKRGYLTLDEEQEFLTRARTMAIENNLTIITAAQEISPIQRHEAALEEYIKRLLSDEDY